MVYQVVGFFDVAARLCEGDGPIAALVGGSSCSMGSAFIFTFVWYSVRLLCFLLCMFLLYVTVLLPVGVIKDDYDYNTVHLMTTKIISQYTRLTSAKEGKYDGAVQ